MALVSFKLISVGGRPPREPASCTIGGTGGKIGRATGNDLVLGQADKLVSRVHARIAWRKDGPVVVACGANPLWVDGKMINRGEEEAIRGQSVLKIGAHEILATVSSCADPEATRVESSGETTIDYRGKRHQWER